MEANTPPKTKNWKSFVAFFLFIIVYGYSAFTDKSADTIWNTGLLAFLGMTLMMGRSDSAGKLIEAVVSLIKKKAEK